MMELKANTTENSFEETTEETVKEDLTYEIWVTFAVLFTISGLLGSIFFLISITYARIKKTHDFDKTNILVFLSNLAIVDALSCFLLLANFIFFVHLLRL